MQTMTPVDMQETNEYTYSKKHIDRYIRTEMLSQTSVVEKIHQGVEMLETWINTDHFPRKNALLTKLRELDLVEFVTDIFVGISYCQTPELLVSITSQLANRLNFSDHRDAIETVAGAVAVVCETDAYDIVQDEESHSYYIESCIPLSAKLLDAIERSEYLPPMVCEPPPLTHNFQSPYLTHNESLVLGKRNGHEGELCLDVLNTLNKIPLSLDTDFLVAVEEEPTFELKTAEQIRDWSKFKQTSVEIYALLCRQGNRFHLTNRVDMRGRVYAQGYHVTTQGTAYKKAMIEFADEEIVQGVPT